MRKRSPTWHPNGNYYSFIQGKRFNLGPNKRKAGEKLRELEENLKSDKLQIGGVESTMVAVDGKKTCHVKELAVRHLQWVKDNRAEETFSHRQRFICHFLDYIGNKQVSDITFTDLDAYYTYARKHHGRGANAGFHALREVKTMFRWGEEFGVCDCPVRKFPVASQKPPTTKKFTEDEIAKLLGVVKPDFADLIRFSILTGLRPIEIRTLKKTDIEINGSAVTIRIEHHKTSESAKTPTPRSVPLAKTGLEIFQRQSKRRPNSEYVFLNADGTLYTRNSLRIRLARACKRAKIPVRPPYAWRHFYGTMQGANETNQAVIAQLMGHTNLQTTARYIANNSSAHQKAALIMEQFI